MTTEYHNTSIPSGPGIPDEITRAFTELNNHLTRIAERLNNLEERVEALEAV